MPIVNLESGKIVGCKRGSLTWHHEKGHIVFNNSKKGMVYNYTAELELRIIVILLTINAFLNSLILKFVSILLGFSIIYFYIYEELWCWNYALGRKR